MIALDSDCIIDFLKGEEKAIQVIKKYGEEQLVTTELNVFEIFLGVYSRKVFGEQEERSASLFFDALEILSLEEGCGKRAARLLGGLMKKGKGVNQNDCLIAAILLQYGCSVLITNNVKHFSLIPGVTIVPY